MSINLKQAIRNVLKELYAPSEKDFFVDKNGKRIVTGKFVKKGKNNEERGQINRVTPDLKVKVTWFLPKEIKGKSTFENPTDIAIYTTNEG